ncbi:DUF3221 domain-containing protein [Clostridium estertheticum]|uniref:DUF3221 domain-containing protein n=1 Tax=Clostridium estertheticum TaxID=238834 RepID=UPI0013E94E68|nr:DUF3221 domain-containing protein [Clostridium estertheticum]MBZ9686468.1 DUF3221 domain-containing protein [Clostridium estertheticum]
MKKIIVFTIISMLAAVMLVGCKSKEITEKPPVSSAKLMAPTVIGNVLEVKEDGKAILVDSTSDNVKGQIWVSIDSKTNFFENVTEGTSIPYHNVSRKFAIGNHVEIFIEGEIKESYPMQATATSVYVNEAKK